MATIAPSMELHSDVTAFLQHPKKMLIGGRWVEAASGKTFETYNPATGEVLARVAEGDREDIDRAVKAARRAFDDGPWPDMLPADRARLLWKIADLIDKHHEELAELETLDNGKPLLFSRIVDVPTCAGHFRYMAGCATKIEGTTIPISMPGAKYFAYTVREPIGVVGQIIPWNFPLIMAALKLAPALAAGCTVVLKPAEQTPLTALRLGELLLEAGIPEGVVNIVPGYGETAGAALAAHPDVDKIAFTGSTEVGRLIVTAAAGNLKKVSLELGGRALTSSSLMPISTAPFPAAPMRFSLTRVKSAPLARACLCTRASLTRWLEGSRTSQKIWLSAQVLIPIPGLARSSHKSSLNACAVTWIRG